MRGKYIYNNVFVCEYINVSLTRIYWIAINGENLMIELHVFMGEHNILYSKVIICIKRKLKRRNEQNSNINKWNTEPFLLT